MDCRQPGHFPDFRVLSCLLVIRPELGGVNSQPCRKSSKFELPNPMGDPRQITVFVPFDQNQAWEQARRINALKGMETCHALVFIFVFPKHLKRDVQSSEIRRRPVP